MTTQIPVTSVDRSGTPSTNAVNKALSPTAQMMDVGNVVKRACVSVAELLFITIFHGTSDATGMETGQYINTEISLAGQAGAMVDTTTAAVINGTKATSGGWQFTLTSDGAHPIAGLAAYLAESPRSLASVVNHLVSVPVPVGAPADSKPVVHVDQQAEAIYVEFTNGDNYITSGSLSATSQALAGTSAAANQWAE